MLYVTSEELKKEILKNFRNFLIQKAKENPRNKTIRDFLKGFEE